MNDCKNLFQNRRSIRKFTSDKIPRDTIMQILHDAMSGPSAMRLDPWEFIVIDDRKILADISQFLPHGTFLKDASCGIIVCGDIARAHANSESYMLQDVSSAIAHLLLSAEAHDIGCCWLGVHPRTERMEAISKYFSLPNNIVPVAAIAMGFKAEEKLPENRFDIKKVHFNGF